MEIVTMKMALGLACMITLASCASSQDIPAPAATTPAAIVAYDGIYGGDMDKISSGDPNVCGGTSHKTLNVTKGVATIVGEPDSRTGSVGPDGSLTMRGVVGVPPRAAPATLIGKFTVNGFNGTSSITALKCEYTWTLMKQ
jgi:hypothetical protein